MTIEEPDVAVLESSIKEYRRIRVIEDEEQRRIEEVEWIVRLVEYPLTAWDGAFELNENRYLPVGSSTWETYARDLTPEQWERITLVLLADDELYSDLLELLRDRKDPRVLAWYLDRIEAVADDAPLLLKRHLYWFCSVLQDPEFTDWIRASWQLELVDLDGEPWLRGYFPGSDEEEAVAIREFVTRARAALLPE